MKKEGQQRILGVIISTLYTGIESLSFDVLWEYKLGDWHSSRLGKQKKDKNHDIWNFFDL